MDSPSNSTATDAAIAAAQAYWSAHTQDRFGRVWDTLSAEDQAKDSREAFIARYAATPSGQPLFDAGDVVSATITGDMAEAFTSSKGPTRADIRRVNAQTDAESRSAALDALPKVDQPHTIRLIRQAGRWRVRLWLTDAEDNARFQSSLRRLEFQLVAPTADPPNTWRATDIDGRPVVLERRFFLQPPVWLPSSVDRTSNPPELRLRLAVDLKYFWVRGRELDAASDAGRELAVVFDGVVIARVSVAAAYQGPLLLIPLPDGLDTAALAHVVETKDLLAP